MKLIFFLMNLCGEKVTVELKSGVQVQGEIEEVDIKMNVFLKNVILTSNDRECPTTTNFDHLAVRGSTIIYVMFDDDLALDPYLQEAKELSNKPFPKKDESEVRGRRGRGGRGSRGRGRGDRSGWRQHDRSSRYGDAGGGNNNRYGRCDNRNYGGGYAGRATEFGERSGDNNRYGRSDNRNYGGDYAGRATEFGERSGDNNRYGRSDNRNYGGDYAGRATEFGDNNRYGRSDNRNYGGGYAGSGNSRNWGGGRTTEKYGNPFGRD